MRRFPTAFRVRLFLTARIIASRIRAITEFNLSRAAKRQPATTTFKCALKSTLRKNANQPNLEKPLEIKRLFLLPAKFLAGKIGKIGKAGKIGNSISNVAVWTFTLELKLMSTQASSSAGGSADNQAAGQTDNNSASSNADANNQPAGGGSSVNQPAGKSYTQEEPDREIEKARKDEAKKSKLSEDERLKSDLDDARAQLRERDARDAVKDAAETAGARSAARVYKIVKDDLEFDAKGSISNLKEVLASAKKDFPELFAPFKSSADGGAGQNSQNQTGGSMNGFIRRATGRQ